VNDDDVSRYERLQIESVLQGPSYPIEPGVGLYLLSPTDRAYEVFDLAAGPAMERNGLNVQRLGCVFDSNSALADVRRWIMQAQIIVADLTPWSHDLMYVLGLCHGLRRCPLLLAEADTELPFNLNSLRCLEYRRTKEELFDLRHRLERAIRVFLTAARTGEG
jgi:hypothetical protein